MLRYEYDGIEVEREDAVCYIASRQEKRGRRSYNIGTAYLELTPETGEPHWFPLGRQLAQHLGVTGLSDAVTMLLTARKDDRDRLMVDRQIQPEDIVDARKQLQLNAEDDEELAHVLDSLLPNADNQEEPVAALAGSTTGTVTAPVPDPSTDEVSTPPSPTAPPLIDFTAV